MVSTGWAFSILLVGDFPQYSVVKVIERLRETLFYFLDCIPLPPPCQAPRPRSPGKGGCPLQEQHPLIPGWAWAGRRVSREARYVTAPGPHHYAPSDTLPKFAKNTTSTSIAEH